MPIASTPFTPHDDCDAFVRESASPARICIAVAAICFLPSLLFYFGAPSLGLGTVAAAFVLIAMSFDGRGHRFSSPISGGALTLVLGLLVMLHGVIAQAILPTNPVRMVSSLAPLAFIVGGGFAFGRLLLMSHDRAITAACRFAFWLMVAVAFIGLAGLSPPGARPFQKPLFPFTEPSHFGLAFTPLLLFQTATTRGAKRAVTLIAALAVALVLQNLTLLVALALAAALVFPIYFAVPLALAVAGIATQLDLTYYLQRLDFSGDEVAMESLSSLVYLQGWQMIGESFERSRGWGLGFQQLGVLGTDVDAGQLIYSLMGDYLNLFDGAFNASKLLSEFGVIGIVLLMALCAKIVRSLRALRANAHRAAPAAGLITFAHCCVAALAIELFIRGAGYFTAGSLLMISALYVLAVSRRVTGAAPAAPTLLRA